MGKFDEAGVVVGLGNDAGPGVDVGGASNAPSVADSTVGSTVDATADTAAGTAGGLSATGYILIGVGGLALILVIAALLFFFFRALSEKQKNEYYDEITEEDIPKDQTASNDLGSSKGQADSSDIPSKPQSDASDTAVPVSASNVQKSKIGNILVSNKEADKVLVGKLRGIVIKIKNGIKLAKKDVKYIEPNEINRIDSNIIKLRSTFGFRREDLADATKDLISVLNFDSCSDEAIAVATERFKKKAGIENLTPAVVVADQNSNLTSLN